MSNFVRRLGNTELNVSALGLGTVKLGRNTGVKYPSGFELPDDHSVVELLALAKELGLNLLDTAPAYGSSEARLGQLLSSRPDWIICTKTGEEYEDDTSRFDFSAQHTRMSIERSLSRLHTDYLDLVLIHSDGNDLDILQRSDCVETLRQCQQEGKIRYIGMSAKTEKGGCLAAEMLDVVMLTWNLEQQDKAALDRARSLNRGVLVKKGLMSGHAGVSGSEGVKNSLQAIFSEPGIHSAVVGTLNLDHLKNNCEITKAVLDEIETGD